MRTTKSHQIHSCPQHKAHKWIDEYKNARIYCAPHNFRWLFTNKMHLTSVGDFNGGTPVYCIFRRNSGNKYQKKQHVPLLGCVRNYHKMDKKDWVLRLRKLSFIARRRRALETSKKGQTYASKYQFLSAFLMISVLHLKTYFVY